MTGCFEVDDPAAMNLYVFLLLSALTAIARGLNCNAVTGDHGFCACTMDDGSGTVDISSYANTDGTPR